MRVEITDDYGDVLIDGLLLPGTFDGLEVEGHLRIDEIEVPGQSGKSVQPMGFEDAAIKLKLRLHTDDQSTCYDKLATLTRIFQQTTDTAKPMVHRLVNKHTALWGIDEVLITELKSSEKPADDIMYVQLGIRQYRPALVGKETRANAAAVNLNPEMQNLLGFGNTGKQSPATASSPIRVDEELVTPD